MTGFCPYKKGSLKESECHHDGYCSECSHNTKDDTISRRAAIDAIKHHGEIENDYTDIYHDGYCDGVFDAVDTLVDLPSTQQWTPCSEGPPKESGTYIITAYDGVSRRVTFVKYQKRLNKWDLSGARSYWHVLAWMPLPKPYKEKSDDKDN